MRLIRSVKDKYAPKGSFTANVVTLMTGTTIAQAISLAVSPVLTRFYHPDEFGIFALFTGISALLSVVSAGRYEFAIVLPESDDDALNILMLSVSLVLCVSIMAFIVVTVVNYLFHGMTATAKYERWVYLIPWYVLVTGVYQCLNLWNNRLKKFHELSISRITLSIGTAVVSLLLGYLQLGVIGLFFGALVGQASATGVLCWYAIREKRIRVGSISIERMKALARRYANFPKIDVLHTFIDNVNTSGTIFIITYYFGAAIVGYYSFMMRVLQAPSGLVSSSLTQVFYQRASETYAGGGDLVGLINSMLKRLALLAVFPALVLLVAGPLLFRTVFGDKWQVAGMYAQILSPYMFLYFIAAPLALVPFIVNKQKQSLLVSTIGNLLFFASIMIGATIFHKIEVGLSIFSALSIAYFVYYRTWIISISSPSSFIFGRSES